MGDEVKLPASPMAGMREDELDPRRALWSARALRIGYAWVAIFVLGVAASTIFFFSLMGPLWTAPDPELLAMIATFPGPNLLLGLLAFQIASRSGRIGRLAAIVARPAGVLLAAGYAYVLVDTWGDVIPVAFGACGVVACALLIVIPARHGSPVVKHATAAATVASAGPPGSLCATLLPFSYVPDLWEGMLTVVACLLPLVGCIALLWLIYTEPGGEA